MVVKNRYLVMEIFCEGEGPALTHSAITNAIKDSILHNFGEFGLGSSLTSLQVKYLNPITKLCVIRCSRTEYERIWCAITFITSISNCPLFFNLLDLSGNIRCCKHATLEYDKAKVELLKLRSGKNQLSPKQLEAASSCLEKISQLEM
eukprot:c21422_g1_i1 orf=100-543(+)